MKKVKFRHTRDHFLGHTKFINTAGFICLGSLTVLGLTFLTPTMYQESNAAATTNCLTTNSDSCLGRSEQVTSDVGVVVMPTIAVGAQTTVTIDVTPKPTENSFASASAKLAVTTNSTAGYSVYMWALNGSGDLQHVNPTETSTITSITKPVTADNFDNNSWGYHVIESDDTLYRPIPTDSNTAIITSDSSSNDAAADDYNIDFGVNVDSNLASGQYYNAVVFSAIANPIAISSLYELRYMQDMTGSICENTPYDTYGNFDPTQADPMSPVTKQLTDTRDGKQYWVAKLRDGNCWMTQNLALDLSTEKTLTPADTNVTEDYTPLSSTRVDDTPTTTENKLSPMLGGSQDRTYTQQYSWGTWKNYVITDPISYTTCSGDTTTLCLSRYTDVGDVDWKPNYVAQDNNAVDETNKIYDAHYLIGNYYQFATATAGTGTPNTQANAPSSICPKGWTLPRAGKSWAPLLNYDTNNGTFGNLLRAYGVAATSPSTAGSIAITLRNYSNKLDASSNIDGTTATYNVTAGQFNIVSSPLYYVRNGNISTNSTFFYTGNYGYYWSRTSHNSSDAQGYLLTFLSGASGTTVNPSSGPSAKYAGAAVRCLQG